MSGLDYIKRQESIHQKKYKDKMNALDMNANFEVLGRETTNSKGRTEGWSIINKLFNELDKSDNWGWLVKGKTIGGEDVFLQIRGGMHYSKDDLMGQLYQQLDSQGAYSVTYPDMHQKLLNQANNRWELTGTNKYGRMTEQDIKDYFPHLYDGIYK